MLANPLLIPVIGILAGALILVLSPIRALCLYSAVLVLHHQSLGFAIGPLDFNSSRLLVIPLSINIAIHWNNGLNRFRWCIMDWFVILYFLAIVIATMVNEPLMLVLERHGSTLFESILPYFFVRLIIHTKRDILLFMKNLCVCAVPLAVFGEYESLSGTNLLGTFNPSDMRHGLYRATGTFDVHIGWGLFFAGTFFLSLGLWNQVKGSRVKVPLFCSLSALGIFSSMSSGPIFSFIASMAMLLCYPIRRFMPLVVAACILLLVTVELVANDHWYEILARMAMSGSTGYYRIELHKEAFGGGMSGHWLFGWGFVGLESSNERFPWIHKDMTSIHIATLARFGLIVESCLLCIIGMSYVYLRNAYVATASFRDKWMIWSWLCLMVGWDFALLSVNTVGQHVTLWYMVRGGSAVLPLLIVKNSNPERQGCERTDCLPGETYPLHHKVRLER